MKVVMGITIISCILTSIFAIFWVSFKIEGIAQRSKARSILIPFIVLIHGVVYWLLEKLFTS